MTRVKFLPIMAILLALTGCNGPSGTTYDFSVLSGDAFDLFRHLQEDVKSERSYYRSRHDEALRALDHLKRIAGGEQERKVAQSLEMYLASIDSERAIVDKRQAVLDSMRSLSIEYPSISNCEPPSPPRSPCAMWFQLKAQLPKLDESIAQEDRKGDAARAAVLIR